MKLIRGCALVMAFLFPAASFAETAWAYLEDTEFGPRYLRSDVDITPYGKYIYTMIDLKTKRWVKIDGIDRAFLSIIFLESVNCEERSRETFAEPKYYSKNMATGTEWTGKSVNGPKYVYSKSDWESKGFDRLFCKKAWEFWRQDCDILTLGQGSSGLLRDQMNLCGEQRADFIIH